MVILPTVPFVFEINRVIEIHIKKSRALNLILILKEDFRITES